MIPTLLAPHATFLALHCVIAWQQRRVLRAVGEGRAEGDLEYWARLGYGASVAHYIASFAIGMIALHLIDGLPAALGFALGFSGWVAFRLSPLQTDQPGRLFALADPGVVRDAWITRFYSTLWYMLPFTVVVLAYHMDAEIVSIVLIGLVVFRLLLDSTHPAFIGWILRPYLQGIRSRRRWQIIDEESRLGGELRRMQAASTSAPTKPPRVRIDPTAQGGYEPDWQFLRKAIGEGDTALPQRLFQELDPDALTAAVAIELAATRAASDPVDPPPLPNNGYPSGLWIVAIAMLLLFAIAGLNYGKVATGTSPAPSIAYATAALFCIALLLAETKRRFPSGKFVALTLGWRIWTWQPLPEQPPAPPAPGEHRRQALGRLLLMLAALAVVWVVLPAMGLPLRWVGIFIGFVAGIGVLVFALSIFFPDNAPDPAPPAPPATLEPQPLPRHRAPEDFIAALTRADASRVRPEDHTLLHKLVLADPVARAFVTANSADPDAALERLRHRLDQSPNR